MMNGFGVGEIDSNNGWPALVDAAKSNALTSIVALLLIGLIVGIGISILTGLGVSRPIRNIVAMLKDIAEGEGSIQTFKHDNAGSGHIDSNMLAFDDAFNDAAGLGMQPNGLLVQVPPEGGIVRLDGPKPLAVLLQFQGCRHPGRWVLIDGPVFARNGLMPVTVPAQQRHADDQYCDNAH
jgi:hypothetical protein